MMDRVQRAVAEVYFAADGYEGEERAEFIRSEVCAQFPG